MQIGTTNFNGGVLEVWDCGISTNMPPPEEIAAAEAKAVAEEKKREATKKKVWEGQAKAFLWLQSCRTDRERRRNPRERD